MCPSPNYVTTLGFWKFTGLQERDQSFPWKVPNETLEEIRIVENGHLYQPENEEIKIQVLGKRHNTFVQYCRMHWLLYIQSIFPKQITCR